MLGCTVGFAVLIFYPGTNNMESMVSRFLFPATRLVDFIAAPRGQ